MIKFFTCIFFLLGTIFGILITLFVIELGKETKPYTVKIVNGSEAIPYISTLDVDSLNYISNKSVVIYLNGKSLPIKADYITFRKN